MHARGPGEAGNHDVDAGNLAADTILRKHFRKDICISIILFRGARCFIDSK